MRGTPETGYAPDGEGIALFSHLLAYPCVLLVYEFPPRHFPTPKGYEYPQQTLYAKTQYTLPCRGEGQKIRPSFTFTVIPAHTHNDGCD
jgi:hypothetical protein